ncbi:MAG: hypothetical protein V7L23_29940 [Nostoc sp.]|uniref:hypothetical protein n=1 Tax=Nostoc sp. TaxID=1180 RepID=UPI002FF271EA
MSYNPSQNYVAANKAGDTFTGKITTTGKAAAYAAKTANYTLTSADEYIEATTAAITITLPDAVANSKSLFNIKNSSSGTVTIATTSSQTIDGAGTFPLPIQYQAISVISNGTNWSIF